MPFFVCVMCMDFLYLLRFFFILFHTQVIKKQNHNMGKPPPPKKKCVRVRVFLVVVQPLKLFIIAYVYMNMYLISTPIFVSFFFLSCKIIIQKKKVCACVCGGSCTSSLSFFFYLGKGLICFAFISLTFFFDGNMCRSSKS